MLKKCPETSCSNNRMVTLGAQSVNPKVKTRVVRFNERFNPPRETEAAAALINGGVDLLMQNTHSPAVPQTAEKMGHALSAVTAT